MKDKRFDGIDILRCIACCMVLIVHSCECYYISNFYANGFEGLDIESWRNEAVWATIIGTLCRTSVPLFVMISGFLLLPMKSGMGMKEFYLKRASRVLVPYIVWTLVYSVYTACKWNEGFTGIGDYINCIFENIAYFFVNFNPRIGHMWYVYMIIGIYLFIPIISPWVEKASKKEMQVFLAIWIVSMCVPLMHLQWPEIWGECSWNPNYTLYYFSGFLGYLLAGAYARKFLYDSEKGFAIPGWLLTFVGYAGACGGVIWMIYNYIPTAENYESYFPFYELTWNFDTITVGMMTLGIFLLMFRLAPNHLSSIVKDYSRLSYGIYLCHIMFLTWFYENVFVELGIPTPCKILGIGALTIITAYALIKVLSYLPKSKWIVG